jgi:hypothetical protein
MFATDTDTKCRRALMDAIVGNPVLHFMVIVFSGAMLAFVGFFALYGLSVLNTTLILHGFLPGLGASGGILWVMIELAVALAFLLFALVTRQVYADYRRNLAAGEEVLVNG